jgi:hypothetical protein
MVEAGTQMEGLSEASNCEDQEKNDELKCGKKDLFHARRLGFLAGF